MSSSTASAGGGIAATTASGAAAGSMVGPYGTVIGAVIGAGIGIYGAITSASDQADIDRQKAALEDAQAGEVARREQENDALAKTTAFKTAAAYSSENAATGHEGGGIGSQLEIQRQTNLQISLNDQAAAFQESQIYAGAGMESQLANNTMTAGYLNAAGQGVKLAGGLVPPSAGVVNHSGIQPLPPAPSPGMNANPAAASVLGGP